MAEQWGRCPSAPRSVPKAHMMEEEIGLMESKAVAANQGREELREGKEYDQNMLYKKFKIKSDSLPPPPPQTRKNQRILILVLWRAKFIDKLIVGLLEWRSKEETTQIINLKQRGAQLQSLRVSVGC